MPLAKGHTSRPDGTQLMLHGDRAEGGTNLDVQQLQLLLGDGGAGRLQHQARFVAPVTQTSAQILRKPTVSHMAIIVTQQSKTPNQTNHCVQIMVTQQSKTPNCTQIHMFTYIWKIQLLIWKHQNGSTFHLKHKLGSPSFAPSNSPLPSPGGIITDCLWCPIF